MNTDQAEQVYGTTPDENVEAIRAAAHTIADEYVTRTVGQPMRNFHDAVHDVLDAAYPGAVIEAMQVEGDAVWSHIVLPAPPELVDYEPPALLDPQLPVPSSMFTAFAALMGVSQQEGETTEAVIERVKAKLEPMVTPLVCPEAERVEVIELPETEPTACGHPPTACAFYSRAAAEVFCSPMCAASALDGDLAERVALLERGESILRESLEQSRGQLDAIARDAVAALERDDAAHDNAVRAEVREELAGALRRRGEQLREQAHATSNQGILLMATSEDVRKGYLA